MAPREPTRAQLSSKLAYQQNTPNFLLKLQNRMNGIPDEDDDEAAQDDEFEYGGEGRAPIPKRPAIPERPADDPGSGDDEDFADEKPQVVVLKEGKHLTEFEAENVRRAERGLPPLQSAEAKAAEKAASDDKTAKASASTSTKPSHQGLSFSSSSKPGTGGSKSNKRKAIGQLEDLKAEVTSKEKSSKHTSKKAKKPSRTLLSFGDDT